MLPFLHGNGLYTGKYTNLCDAATLSVALIYLMVLQSGFYHNPIIFTEGIKMSNIRNWAEDRG